MTLAYIILGALIALLFANTLLIISAIGKPRKPATHGTAITVCVVNTFWLLGLAYVWTRVS